MGTGARGCICRSHRFNFELVNKSGTTSIRLILSLYGNTQSGTVVNTNKNDRTFIRAENLRYSQNGIFNVYVFHFTPKRVQGKRCLFLKIEGNFQLITRLSLPPRRVSARMDVWGDRDYFYSLLASFKKWLRPIAPEESTTLRGPKFWGRDNFKIHWRI